MTFGGRMSRLAWRLKVFETWIVGPVLLGNGGVFSDGVPTYRGGDTGDMSIH